MTRRPSMPTQEEFDAMMDGLIGNEYSLIESLEICKRAMGWSTKRAAMEMLEGFESGALELAAGSQGDAMDRLRAIINGKSE